MSLSAAALFRVDGTVAVITGGGTGIGLIMARALAANGARRVFILGRRRDVVDSAADAANKELGVTDVLVPVVCDVTDKASLQASVDTVSANLAGADKTGSVGVNLLVCNAGTSGPSMFYDPQISVSALRQRMFTDADPAAMTDAFHVNVTGAYFTAMAYLELLDAGNQSSPDSIQSQIVVTSSIASFMRGRFSAAPYVGSKMAILQITKQLSAMLSPYKIRANALAPGCESPLLLCLRLCPYLYPSIYPSIYRCIQLVTDKQCSLLSWRRC